MRHLVSRRVSVALVIAAMGCAEGPAGPADTTMRPQALIATGDVTLQLLPVPSGWYGEGRAVSASGTIFANNGRTVPTSLYAWSAPYTAQPVLVDANGTIQSGTSAANSAGAVAGFKGSPTRKGAWTQGPPGTWSFVETPSSGYSQLGTRAINDAGGLAGYLWVPGATGPAASRAAFFPAPGAPPIELPLPGPSTVIGASGNGLNEAGDVVGYAWETVGSGRSATTLMRPILWQRTGPASWTAIRLPNSNPNAHSTATAINDAGQIAGGGNAGNPLVRWTPSGAGWVVEQVAAAGTGSYPQIDGCGRVAGGAVVSGKNRAFVWDGTLTVLPIPSGATVTGANDIVTDEATGRGAIVGFGRVGTSGSPYPVRWTIPGCP